MVCVKMGKGLREYGDDRIIQMSIFKFHGIRGYCGMFRDAACCWLCPASFSIFTIK